MSNGSDFGVQFEWMKHEKCVIYQSSEMSFKIKREKLEVARGELEAHGIEVYISDNPREKNWRPIRLFREDSQEAMARIMKWVERLAERLTEDKEIEMKRAD